MKAISSQAAMKMQTRYKFNGGTELETSFDVDYYETYFRQYDAQIGRFTGIDALSEKTMSITTYGFASNNPINFNDPTGLMIDYKNTRGELTNWNPQLKIEPRWLTDFWDEYWSNPFAAEEAAVASAQSQQNIEFWNDVFSLPDHGYAYINNTYIQNVYTTTRYWYSNGIDAVFNTDAYQGDVTFTVGEYYSYLGKTEPADKPSDQPTNNYNVNKERFDPWETIKNINELTSLVKEGTEEAVIGVQHLANNMSGVSPKIVEAGKFFKGASRGMLYAGIFIDGVGVYNYYLVPSSNFQVTPGKFVLNTGVSYGAYLIGGPWGLVIGAAYYIGDKSGFNEATGEYISTLKQINEENKNEALWHIH
jgi:RHS repeat-associated protein